MTTNVKPEELNYNNYSSEKYDNEIIRSIPGHEELHQYVEEIVVKNLSNKKELKVLELGIGTGITAETILKIIPQANYTAIDFSKQMLNGAKKRLANYKVKFFHKDYSEINLPLENDLIISVISIHHQKNKKDLFAKIYQSLKPRGTFIFGDLVTFSNPEIVALNEAKHFHHLVENAQDEKSLKEWAYHHKYLNCISPLENQIKWLEDTGFTVKLMFQKFNTILLQATKEKSKIARKLK